MHLWASTVAQLVKNPPAMQETWVRSLGWENPLEKGKATHSSILAWRIPGDGKESDTTERLLLRLFTVLAHCALCFATPIVILITLCLFSCSLLLIILAFIEYLWCSEFCLQGLPVLAMLILKTNLWVWNCYHSHFKGEEISARRVKKIVQNHKGLSPESLIPELGLPTVTLRCFSRSAPRSQEQAFILVLLTSGMLSRI